MVFIFDLGTLEMEALNLHYFDEITQPGTTPVVTGPTLPLDLKLERLLLLILTEVPLLQ
jgi:hypothetical protein